MKELNSFSNHIKFTFQVYNINFLHVNIDLLNGHLMTNGHICIKPTCVLNHLIPIKSNVL